MNKTLPKLKPVFILLTTYNRINLLKRTIDLINQRTFYPFRILVIDNNSSDGTDRYLRYSKTLGKIFDSIILPENIGQSKALNIGFQEIEKWENGEDRPTRPSNQYFVTSNDDLYPPMLGQDNCWLTQMIDILKRHELEYGGICMRIQRLARTEIDEATEVIPCFKGFPSVFRLLKISDFKQLGDRPFGRLQKWDSNSTADKMKLQLKKKFGFTTHIYADHSGFMIDNKGFPKGTDTFTVAVNKLNERNDKPYPDIDPLTNIPTKVNHGCDKAEQDKRDEYAELQKQSDAIHQKGKIIEVLHKNGRSTTTKIDINGTLAVKKVFNQSNYFENDKLANELFKDFKWMTGFIDSGFDYFIKPFFNEETRLDKYTKGQTQEWKDMIAGKVLGAILDMYMIGYSHRDIHTKNIFIQDDDIKIIDFEYLKERPYYDRVFLETYDIVGRGMSSPGMAQNMCYTKYESTSIWQCLGVDIHEAMLKLIDNVSEELFKVSGTFKALDGEHSRNKGKSYSSFDSPHFKIDDAQRDTQKRLENFNISVRDIADKTVLDLGSNVGGILLGLEKYKPLNCLGVEYLQSHVDVANKIVTIENFNNFNFICKDIDEIKLPVSTFDVVFALSINKHVKDENKLYELLGVLTSEKLYFEGNDGTDKDDVIKKLKDAGFKNVEYLGVCDDDIKSSNNIRPLFIANK